MKRVFSEKELQQADEIIRQMTPLNAFLFREMMNVQELHDNVVDINQIMICPFDLFGKDACRYTFQEVCGISGFKA